VTVCKQRKNVFVYLSLSFWKIEKKIEIWAAILGLVMKNHAKYNENPSMATG